MLSELELYRTRPWLLQTLNATICLPRAVSRNRLLIAHVKRCKYLHCKVYDASGFAWCAVGLFLRDKIVWKKTAHNARMLSCAVVFGMVKNELRKSFTVHPIIACHNSAFPYLGGLYKFKILSFGMVGRRELSRNTSRLRHAGAIDAAANEP